MAFLPGVGETSIGQALIRIGVDTRQMKAQMAQMNAQLKGEMAATGQTIERQGQSWGKALTALKLGFVAVGVGLAVFTVDAIKSAAAFDKAMAKVYALTGQSAKAMADLEKQVMSLAERVPQGPTKLAEGLYYVVSAGFSAADALKVLEVAAMDATVGLTDTQTVADGLTSAMNAYNYTAKDAAHVSDVLTAAVTAGKMEWSQLAHSIGTAAVQGSTAGVKLEEVTSAIATMTRSGLTAQRASMGVATLLRALQNPSAGAAKEMAALGLKFDSTTLKSKGLIGTLAMLSKAAGEHHDVIVKTKKGTVDWDKSMEATMAANKGWAANLQKMTGNARGFLAAQIMLSNGSKAYNEIYAASLKASDGIGLTAESFNKMKEADPGLLFDLLKNKVQVAAIEFGKTLMPQLSKFVAFLLDAIPAAMKAIADTWNGTLGPAVGEMMKSFGEVAASIVGIFGGQATNGGDAFKTILQGIASVLAAVARDVGTVASGLAAVFSNPIVQGLTRVVGIFLLLRATMGGIMGIAGGLDSRFRGLARGLTGGLLFKNGKGAPLSPVDASAAKLAEAGTATAGELVTGGKAAGAELIAAAQVAASNFAMKGIGVGGAGAAMGGGAARINAGALKYLNTPLPGTYSDISSTAARAESMAAAARQAEMQAAKAGATIRSAGQRAADAIRNGVSTIGSKVSGALGFASKLFWPAMIATIAVEFIKAPLGDMIAGNPQFRRAGEKIKDDFFGGLVDLFTLSMQGADAAVGRANTMTIGKAHISTAALAKIGITNATFTKLEAPAGTIENAIGQWEAEKPRTDELQRKAGEDVYKWWDRVKDLLDETAKTAITDQFNANRSGGKVDAGWLESVLTPAVTTEVRNATGAVNEGIRASLVATLKARGFTAGQIARIPADALKRIGDVALKDTEGTLGFLQDYIVQQASGATAKSSAEQVGRANAGRKKLAAEFKAALGDNWRNILNDTFDPKGAVLKGLDPAHIKRIVGRLGDQFGPDKVQSTVARFLAKPIGPPVPAGFSGVLDVHELRKNADAARAEWQKTTDPFVKQVLADFISDTNKIDPGLIEQLKKRFGDDWVMAMHAGTKGIGTGKVSSAVATKMQKALGGGWQSFIAGLDLTKKIDPAVAAKLEAQFGSGWRSVLTSVANAPLDGKIVKEMAARFGPNWRQELSGFGALLFEQGGGADAVLLRKGIATAISAEIGKISTKDLNAPDVTTHVNRFNAKTGEKWTETVTGATKDLTPEAAGKVREALQRKVNSLIKNGFVEMAGSADPATAAKGKQAINRALTKLLPDATTRANFIKAITNVSTEAQSLKGAIDAAGGVIDSLGPIINALGFRVDTLGTKFQRLSDILGKIKVPGAGTPSNEPRKPVGRTPVPSAEGNFLGAGQASWVGERGRELFVPGLSGGVLPHSVSEFISAFLPNVGPMLATAAAGGARGSNQSIYVDRMNLNNASDEQDVVQRLAFLMPGGR